MTVQWQSDIELANVGYGIHLRTRLIGRFPIYREATDQPGPEMNSISNISQFNVTLPLDCHSDQVSVNGKDFMVNHATGLPLSQFNATVSLECHSDHFQSNFLRIHLWMRLIGRFPIYIGKRPISLIQR